MAQAGRNEALLSYIMRMVRVGVSAKRAAPKSSYAGIMGIVFQNTAVGLSKRLLRSASAIVGLANRNSTIDGPDIPSKKHIRLDIIHNLSDKSDT